MAQSAAEVFSACACVMATRAAFDGLLLDALAAPGLVSEATGALTSFLTSGELERAQESLELIVCAVEAGEELA